MNAIEIGLSSMPCPCCGNLTIEEPGQYEICPVFQWQDDPVQSGDPSHWGLNGLDA
ncbi:CPCC family cysteine-rich protein [Xanthomonas sacchari]|uniref:CPCC family cysteine-rich protein n=1 Tax=Xanthomonas sacchari TaxID=56458 RepID=UPI001263E397|nr:hypothetical protein CEK65_01420 [Xanthomonas sp. LMG 12459]